MQRIVKLELFVKEIQKNTDKDVNHDDYWALNSAQGEIEDICLYINQIKCVIDDYGKQTESRINVCFIFFILFPLLFFLSFFFSFLLFIFFFFFSKIALF